MKMNAITKNPFFLYFPSISFPVWMENAKLWMCNMWPRSLLLQISCCSHVYFPNVRLCVCKKFSIRYCFFLSFCIWLWLIDSVTCILCCMWNLFWFCIFVQRLLSNIESYIQFWELFSPKYLIVTRVHFIGLHEIILLMWEKFGSANVHCTP